MSLIAAFAWLLVGRARSVRVIERRSSISGMFARLRFSIAVEIEARVGVVGVSSEEVLSFIYPVRIYVSLVIVKSLVKLGVKKPYAVVRTPLL